MKLTKLTKRFLVSAVAVSMSMTAVAWPAPVAAAEAEEKVPYCDGDVTGEGDVNLVDAQEVLKAALGIGEGLSVEAKKAADLDGLDGIGLVDAQIVLKLALGIPVEIVKPTEIPPVGPIRPSDEPFDIVTATPAPTSIPLPLVTPGTAVEGTKIMAADEASLHGATVDEKGIYTFTDANKEAARGIKMTNPWAGKTSLRQTVAEALPKFFVDSEGTIMGKVVGNKIIAMDGSKTVIATWKEDPTVTNGAIAVMVTEEDVVTDEAVDVTDVVVDTTDEAADVTNEAADTTNEAADTTDEATDVTISALNVTDDAANEIKGTLQTWNYNMIPSDNRVAGKYNAEYAEAYTKPEWTNGVSISFWAKADWATDLRTDSVPLLVIKDSSGCDNANSGEYSGTGHGGDFAFMMKLNGAVSFEGDQTGNCFRTTNHFAGNNHEWNYYTVTFANDWITVYVNGQELVYATVELDKDNIKYFNDGFLTRYSPAYEIAKDDVEDVRNYLQPGWLAADGSILSRMNIEFTLTGNSRYANQGAVIGYELLIDALTDEGTEIWFGSSSVTQCTCLTGVNTGSSAYKLTTGTQVAEVYCYEKELTAAEVAANYEKEYAANTELLGLKKAE